MLMKFVSAALLVTVAGAASARHQSDRFDPPEHFDPPKHFDAPAICPELDPSSMMSGLSLLLAGLAVVRSRNANSPDA